MSELDVLDLLADIPNHYADRVPADQMHHLRNDASGGEWGLLLQELLLHLRKATVTPNERRQLAAMVAYVEEEGEPVTIDQPLNEVLDEIPVRED